MRIDGKAQFTRGSRGSRLAPTLLAALAALASGAAGAEPNPFGFGSGVPWVFQSGYGTVADDPGFDHHTRVLPLGTSTLHLYATAGSQPSEEGERVCSPAPEGGSGDETCGLDVQVNVTGPAFVAGFRPAGPPGGSEMSFFPTSFGTATRSLRFNSVRATDPIPAGAWKLAELDVTVTGTTGVSVSVSGNAMVLGQRQVVPIEPNIIAVPEPEQTWLLASALVGLAGLAARRRSRRMA